MIQRLELVKRKNLSQQQGVQDRSGTAICSNPIPWDSGASAYPCDKPKGAYKSRGSTGMSHQDGKRGHSCGSGGDGGIWLGSVRWGKKGYNRQVQERPWCQHHWMEATKAGEGFWMGKHSSYTFVEVWGRKWRNGRKIPIRQLLIPLTII